MNSERIATPPVPDLRFEQMSFGDNQVNLLVLPNSAVLTTSGQNQLSNMNFGAIDALVFPHTPPQAHSKSGTLYPSLAQMTYITDRPWIVVDPQASDDSFLLYSDGPFVAAASATVSKVGISIKKGHMGRRDFLGLSAFLTASLLTAQWNSGLISLPPNVQDLRHTAIACGLKQLYEQNENNLLVVVEEADVNGIQKCLTTEIPDTLAKFYARFNLHIKQFNRIVSQDNRWHLTSSSPLLLS
ncbi:MAG: hypothetical protein NUV65_02820 [Candidatus Roizmanbacteria bacterium]|nr:hypothetical protein [Candidatus Roizmanbacteria bacterium]